MSEKTETSKAAKGANGTTAANTMPGTEKKVKKPFEQKDNTGAMFKNDKEGNDKRPDIKGSATINGKKMLVSGWKKVSESFQSYYVLSFTLAEQSTTDEMDI
jgi:hypothetical protein